ncbi:MAG: hypothetical protein ACTSO7_16985, partial [Candidatus Heimdallarchaeota archaeon]
MSEGHTKTGKYLIKDGYARLNLHDHINEYEIDKLPRILALALHLGFYAISIVERQTDDNLASSYKFSKLADYLEISPFYVRNVKIDNKKLDYLVNIGLKDSFLDNNPKWNYLKNREVKFLRGKEFEGKLHLLAFGPIPAISSESIDVIMDSCMQSGCAIVLPHALSETSGGLVYEFARRPTKKYLGCALGLEINGNAPKRHNELVLKLAKMLNLPLTAGQDLHLDWGENHELWYGTLPVTGLNENCIINEDTLSNL